MKKFLKPTKVKTIICLLGGLAYPCVIFLLQYLEPEGYIRGAIAVILLVFVYVISIIPSSLIHLGRLLFDPTSLVVDNERDDGFYWTITLTVIPLFNFIFFYLLASWFEWRKNNKKKANEKIS